MGRSRRSRGIRVIALLLMSILAAPALSQQAEEPSVVERIRGFFDRLFSDESKPAAETASPPPRAEPAPPEPVAPEPAKPGPAAPPRVPVESRSPPPPDQIAPQAVKPTPAAQAASKSLHEYIAKGDYGNALKLIEQGADVETKDPGAGASVLHYAVMRGRMPVIDLLISRGADVNSRTKMGTTPLHTAVLYARLEVAELLLDAGADVNARSSSGATPLAIAEASRNQPIATMLRGRGAK